MLTTDKFTFTLPAQPGERFAEGAFAPSLGREYRMKRPVGDWVQMWVKAAEVVDGGTAVEITVECPSGVALLVDTLEATPLDEA